VARGAGSGCQGEDVAKGGTECREIREWTQDRQWKTWAREKAVEPDGSTAFWMR
jgi:hypothetical protein